MDIKMAKLYQFIFLCTLMSSCLTPKTALEYEIEEGFYNSKIFGQNEKVYLDNERDSLYVFPISKDGQYYKLDTGRRKALIFPQKLSEISFNDNYFTTHGLDIDVIAIPFKYRFPVSTQPQQLSSNLNVSLYGGYRTDYYSFKYRKNKFGQYERNTRHYGLSFGGFSGFGSSPVTPWFTNDMITEEYDGLVWSNGVVVSLGIDRLNLGAALGWDRLLDSNSSVWIYQSKPWLGLVIGININ